MKIGRVGPIGHEIPVVFENKDSAIVVDSLISDWSRDSLTAGALEQVQAADLATLPRIATADVRVAAPVARPTKIICIGLNYRKHAEETGAAFPTEPVIFMKASKYHRARPLQTTKLSLQS